MSHRPNAKCRWFATPTHVPAIGQWWSILCTHRPHSEQCFERSGRAQWHVWQNRPSEIIDVTVVASRRAAAAAAGASEPERFAAASSDPPPGFWFFALSASDDRSIPFSLRIAFATRIRIPVHTPRSAASAALGRNPGPTKYVRKKK